MFFIYSFFIVFWYFSLFFLTLFRSHITYFYFKLIFTEINSHNFFFIFYSLYLLFIIFSYVSDIFRLILLFLDSFVIFIFDFCKNISFFLHLFLLVAFRSLITFNFTINKLFWTFFAFSSYKFISHFIYLFVLTLFFCHVFLYFTSLIIKLKVLNFMFRFIIIFWVKLWMLTLRCHLVYYVLVYVFVNKIFRLVCYKSIGFRLGLFFRLEIKKIYLLLLCLFFHKKVFLHLCLDLLSLWRY